VSSEPRREQPPRPWWRLGALGLARAFDGLVIRPLRRLYDSADPIDAYALNHLTSVAGDALLALSLADSVFFSVPVGQARLHVAGYLALTMLPLALAGPLLVPILDRAGPRRSVTFAAAAGRCLLAALLAPRLNTLLLFPLALLMLMLSKVHAIVKNGLTMAYANREEGLMRANARLGRIAAAGALGVAPIGLVVLKLAGGKSPIYLASIVYGISALLTARLPRPVAAGVAGGVVGSARPAELPRRRRGQVPRLRSPAMGAIGLRAAGGFLLFLLAFSLRSAEVPAYWFGVIAGASVAGGFLADLVAPRLPTQTREEAVVAACVLAAGLGALLASQLFGLLLLACYALIAGAASEFARLAFQSLMQRFAPEGKLGSVFVRYEVMFQVAWVAAAFVPTLLPISFRLGIVLLAGFYATLAGVYWWRSQQGRGTAGAPGGAL
jgi:hypothetical protein